MKIHKHNNLLHVKHCRIGFSDASPVQNNLPHQRNFNKSEEIIINRDINKMLEMNVIKEVEFESDQYLSPIFLFLRKKILNTE